MKVPQPLLLNNLGLSVAGLRVHRARLHPEAPEDTAGPHHHDHEQLFFVFDGRLRLSISGKELHGRAGTVFLVPADTTHEVLLRPGEERPLCLVIDLRLVSDAERVSSQSQIGLPDLRKARATIQQVLALEMPDRTENRIIAGSAILGILDPCLRAAGWIREIRARHGHSVARVTTKSVERYLERSKENAEAELSEIAQKLGYDLRQLNRILKRECDCTLGQVRAKYRLRRTQQLLRMGRSVAESGAEVGMGDSNYFSRWFRKQTGMTPRQWNQSGAPPEGSLGG